MSTNVTPKIFFYAISTKSAKHTYLPNPAARPTHAMPKQAYFDNFCFLFAIFTAKIHYPGEMAQKKEPGMPPGS